MLRVGAAPRSLGVPVGIAMGGYGGRMGPSVGQHDDLQVRALTLRSGDEHVGLVVCDLVALDPSTIARFRQGLASRSSLDPDRVVVAVTHTHSGPTYGNMLARYAGQAGVKARFPEWEADLPERMLEALRAAEASECEATLRVARGHAEVSVNRRLPDARGEVRLHPNPAGPIDPEVVVMRFDAADGRAIATLVAYACHAVTLCEDNVELSADFVHYLRQSLEAQGSGMVLYVNGACGNLNPSRRGDYAAAEWVGSRLAQAAGNALASASVDGEASVALAAATGTVALALKPENQVTAAARYVEAARLALSRHSGRDDYEGRRLRAEVERAERQVGLAEALAAVLTQRLGPDGQLTARIQAIRIGPAYLVAVPGEVFVELGATLKQALAPAACVLVGYANESIGYVPTRSAYLEGGYEPESSWLRPGSGEALIDGASRLARGLGAEADEGTEAV